MWGILFFNGFSCWHIHCEKGQVFRLRSVTKFQASVFYSEMNIKLTPFTPWIHIMEAKIQLHSFITSALDGGKWSVSHFGRFVPVKERHLLNKRLGGSQSRAGRFGEGKNLSPLSGFEPRTVHPFYSLSIRRLRDMTPYSWVIFEESYLRSCCPLNLKSVAHFE